MRWPALGTLLLLAAPASGADILASRPTFRTGQKQVFCSLSNVGSTAVTISHPKVTAEIGPAFDLPFAVNNCASTLRPGKNCSWLAYIRTGGAHFCRVTVSSKSGVRGQMEIATFEAALAMEEMR